MQLEILNFSKVYLNPHPEDIIHTGKIILTPDHVKPIKKVIDGRGIITVGSRLRLKTILKTEIVP